MGNIVDIVAANCITIGIIFFICTNAELNITRQLQWNGITNTQYTLRFCK